MKSETRGSRATKTRLVKKTAKKEEQLIHVHKKSPMSNNTFEQSTDLSVYILHEKNVLKKISEWSGYGPWQLPAHWSCKEVLLCKANGQFTLDQLIVENVIF